MGRHAIEPEPNLVQLSSGLILRQGVVSDRLHYPLPLLLQARSFLSQGAAVRAISLHLSQEPIELCLDDLLYGWLGHDIPDGPDDKRLDDPFLKGA